VKERREQVERVFQERMPDFPLELLRSTFQAKVYNVRSPEVDYGPGYLVDPRETSVVPQDPWVIPKPPKGDYPAVVVEMSPQKRRFLLRRRLPRARPAGKIKEHYEHE